MVHRASRYKTFATPDVSRLCSVHVLLSVYTKMCKMLV